MAKRKRDGSGSWSYLNKLFDEHPEWLEQRSNDLILARYREDHGLAADTPIEKAVKNNLANLKSVRRKKLRDAGKPRAVAAVKHTAVAVETVASPRRTSKLEDLELLIDDCLTMARNLNRDGMDEIITMLRRARREVVWKMGE